MASINGTNVAAMIAPFDTADTFPTHDAKYGKGGYRSVSTIAERDAIPSKRLSDGCVCFVIETKEEYRYNESKSAWYEVDKTFTQEEWDALGEEGQREAYELYSNIYITEE